MSYFADLEDVIPKKVNLLPSTEESAMILGFQEVAGAEKKHIMDEVLAGLGDLEKQAKNQEVFSAESSHEAFEMICQIKTINNALEKKRKEILAPSKRYTDAINAFAKRYKDVCQKITGSLIRKRDTFEKQEEEKRKEIEREQRRKELLELEKKQKEIREQKAKENPFVPPKPCAEITQEIKKPCAKITQETKKTCADGSATKKAVWRWEVIDKEKIPQEFLSIDTVAINQAVRAGNREIEGLRIFETMETVYKAKAQRY